MNSKYDLFHVNKNVILDSLHVTGKTLCHIINESLSTGVFPESWKESIIIPIEKVARTKKCEEFRGINMLPTHEKLLEKIVIIQLEKYITDNNILIDVQSGYRRNHSCESALNSIICKWKEAVDKKKVIVSVFLDFSRAFETVDRCRLLCKLESIGISGVELMWMESYLTRRTQRTKFGESLSEAKENHLGVPQGSVLGPLLFIIYINDVLGAINFCSLHLFADDILLYFIGDDVNAVIETINNDLSNIQIWLQANKLKLNTNKTKCMIINNKNNIPLINNVLINNEQIGKVSEIKYLGIIIDNKLKFESNLNYIIKKISSKINFLFKIRNKLSIMSRIKYYISSIAVHIEYCSTILFLCNEGELDQLQKLQNRGMRAILGCNKYTSVKWMLDALNWMNVKQRLYFNTINMIYKIKNNLAPKYLGENINYIKDIHEKNLRNTSDIRLPFFRLTKSQNNLFYKGSNLYNLLPSDIKNSKDLFEFKKRNVIYIKQNF